MPAYLVYVLIIFAIATVAGAGFKLGSGLMSFFTTVGFVIVLIALWEPLLKPTLKRLTKK